MGVVQTVKFRADLYLYNPIHAVCGCSVTVMAAKSNKLHFTLNGQPIEVDNPDPQQLLVHWLRESGYTGTKVSIYTFIVNYIVRYPCILSLIFSLTVSY